MLIVLKILLIFESHFMPVQKMLNTVARVCGNMWHVVGNMSRGGPLALSPSRPLALSPSCLFAVTVAFLVLPIR